MEGYFFNDLVAFDLNALQQATNRWEILIQNTIDGGPPHGQIPPARTNHTMITYGDRLYLFGGTDGVHWFNDVWSYSPQSNSWTQLECIGYIPSPREGHAAALVGDVMYVFGGRTEEGNDLGDLAAFRISSRRWYTFQNMGPSPSPRSGHSMTTVGKQIVVLAGEPSSAPRDPVELGMAYFLDTSKIRYPPDSANPTPNNERIQGQGYRRPSGERSTPPIGQSRGPATKEITDRSMAASGDRMRSPDSGSRLPRAQAQLPAPAGPPPQAPGQIRQNGVQPASRQPTRPEERALSPENERPRRFDTGNAPASEGARFSPVPKDTRGAMSPTHDSETSYWRGEQHNDQQIRQKPETYQPTQDQTAENNSRSGSSASRMQGMDPNSRSASSASRAQGLRTDLANFDETPRQSVDQPEATSKARKISEEHERPQDSGLGSSPALTHQYDGLARELEQTKQRNAWYASELALARKSGYQSRSAESPVFDERATDGFSDADRPLIEALLKMRAELARVQETIDEQSRSAAGRIAEIEKQRDAAINEAVFAKARLAGQGSPQPDEGSKEDRSNDISRRLVSSLEAQTELSRRIDTLIKEVEAEKTARELAEDTATAAQKRATELEVYRQQHTSEIESLRSELHEAQKQAREASASHAEILTQHRILAVDKSELSKRLDNATTDGQNHSSMLMSLREAVTASSDKSDLLERQLEEERRQRSEAERALRELKSQHDVRTSELESTTRRLRDAEEMATKHAEEARTHRSAVLAGFGKTSERDGEVTGPNEERIAILQQQVEAANVMVRQNQAAADAASEKLRRAEERIAGLETYQEQASREGLNIRKQLQVAMKENQSLSSEKADMEQRLERHMLETNALSVQHASLKDILGERGVSGSDKRRSRALDSPSSTRFSTPDLHRVRELEQQLESSLKGQDEIRSQYEEISERGDKMKREYEEKLTALDNDHQAAVKYLRGTEKMLSKMKQELQRVKNDNGDLKKKLDKAMEDAETTRATPDHASAAWEAERENLQREVSNVQASMKKSVSELEGKISTVQQQLQHAQSDLQEERNRHTTAQTDLSTLQTSFTQSRSDIERLQKDNVLLEERAKDAENKVQLLLDQVESSVDNYRRQSRTSNTGTGTPIMNGAFHPHAPSISEASESSPSHVKTHSRDPSGTGSIASESAAGDARNSLALDSLATELDALRSHWETTNKNYRLSDRFEFEPSSASASAIPAGSGLADWRRGLELDDDDDQTRPGTSNGSNKPPPVSGHSRVTTNDTPTPTGTTHAVPAASGAL